jgi:hypothetical protein
MVLSLFLFRCCKELQRRHIQIQTYWSKESPSALRNLSFSSMFVSVFFNFYVCNLDFSSYIINKICKFNIYNELYCICPEHSVVTFMYKSNNTFSVYRKTNKTYELVLSSETISQLVTQFLNFFNIYIIWGYDHLCKITIPVE